MFRKWLHLEAHHLPAQLEPVRGAVQCNFELLRAFSRYLRARGAGLRYTLAAGTLLGAMRNDPPGLLQWEHDVDVYIPAKDAAELLVRLRRDCGSSAFRHGRQSRSCSVLEFRGLVDRTGSPCCGFGFKLFHHVSSACELDALVLALSDAPFMHGETRMWPIWGPWLSGPYCRMASAWHDQRFYVIPEDIDRKSIMAPGSSWCNASGAGYEARRGGYTQPAEWAWCGPQLSYFHAEYFAFAELFPSRSLRMHGLLVKVPREPWALLERAYGSSCRYIARIDEHGGIKLDLRHPENAWLRKPAAVGAGRGLMLLVYRWGQVTKFFATRLRAIAAYRLNIG